MKPHSLLRRLLWQMGAITVVTATVVAVILIFTFKSQIDDLRGRSLQGQAKDIARHLAVEGGAFTLRLPDELERAYSESSGGFVYAVIGDNGRVLFASKGQNEPLRAFAPRQSAALHFFSFQRPDQDNVFYGVSLPVTVKDRTLLVQAAQGPKHRDVLLDSVFEEVIVDIGWVLPVLLMFLMLVAYLSVKRSLAPLRKASMEAAAIGPATADRRLPEHNIPLEVRPLVRAVNSALDRLQKGIETQRAFTSDAAHELRTPLAILKAHVQTLPDRTAALALGHDVARMERIVEQLLRLAQVEGYEVDALERADLHAIAVEVATMMAPLAARQAKTIEVIGPSAPLIVAGNANLMTLAVRNLVDNGLQHTPTGGGVEISLDPEGGITVTDQGPGIPKELREHVFRRFWRGARDTGGNAGLGLSIVERCVQICGGDVTIADAANGGAVITIRLPTPTS